MIELAIPECIFMIISRSAVGAAGSPVQAYESFRAMFNAAYRTHQQEE
jgi:hypothetical protein